MRSRATVTGSLKRRGPALPGLRKSTRSRDWIEGLCEWPKITAANWTADGSRSSSERSCRPEQEWPYRDGFGRGQLPCPGLGIDVAAHGIGRRNLPKAVEYLGPAHIRGVDNEVGPLQGGNGLKAQQA